MYDKLTDEQKGVVVGEMKKLQEWYCLILGYGCVKAHELAEEHRERIISEVFAGTFKSQFGGIYCRP